MPEPRDECRPVVLPSGETIRVRGRGEMTPEGITALAEIVDAARALHAAENPARPDCEALYERIEATRGTLNWRQVAAEAGVKFSTLFRIGQGHMPDPEDLAAIERWLARAEATDDTSEEH